MNCANCKHWDPFFDASTSPTDEDDLEYDYDVHEWCRRLGERWGACKRTIMGSGKAQDRASIAVTIDGSHYHAHLETREDFGCTQFEECRP